MILTLTDAKLGNQYYLYQTLFTVDPARHSPKPNHFWKTVEATLIGIDRTSSALPYLFGWTDPKSAIYGFNGEMYELYSHSLFRTTWKNTEFYHQFESYGAFIWAPKNTEVAGVQVANVETIASVCICTRCRAANPWAVPNRPDNKYVCFECR